VRHVRRGASSRATRQRSHVRLKTGPRAHRAIDCATRQNPTWFVEHHCPTPRLSGIATRPPGATNQLQKPQVAHAWRLEPLSRTPTRRQATLIPRVPTLSSPPSARLPVGLRASRGSRSWWRAGPWAGWLPRLARVVGSELERRGGAVGTVEDERVVQRQVLPRHRFDRLLGGDPAHHRRDRMHLAASVAAELMDELVAHRADATTVDTELLGHLLQARLEDRHVCLHLRVVRSRPAPCSPRAPR